MMIVTEWPHSRFRVATMLLAIGAVISYELAPAFYRPYIYSRGIEDFHIADTLGNSLGTVATVLALRKGRGFTACRSCRSGYCTRMFRDRIGVRFQPNVRNVTENGSLSGVAVNPDGQYWQYRIIDPRQFIFTTTFRM